MSSRTYYDPLHQSITLNSSIPEEKMVMELIDSSPFQRLRRIKQLGPAYLTFHGAESSRFTHSLGVFHLARRAINHLLNVDSGLKEHKFIIYGAALLHDLGHGPLSHTSEEIFKIKHESWTAKLINSSKEITTILNKYGKGNAKAISDLIQSRKAEKKSAKPKAVKKAAKPKAEKPKKLTKAQIAQAKKDAKAAKEKEEAEAKAAKEAAERTPEDDLEEQFSDEQIRNFQIEKMDMDKLTNKVCEIIAEFEDKGVLQSELWKKLKLNSRDGSRLALRLERRGLISREKILQKGRWTYKLIIEQAPIKLESLVDSPCLTCPVEQKCDFENAYPEPSPLHCQLIENWVAVEFKKKK